MVCISPFAAKWGGKMRQNEANKANGREKVAQGNGGWRGNAQAKDANMDTEMGEHFASKCPKCLGICITIQLARQIDNMEASEANGLGL